MDNIFDDGEAKNETSERRIRENEEMAKAAYEAKNPGLKWNDATDEIQDAYYALIADRPTSEGSLDDGAAVAKPSIDLKTIIAPKQTHRLH